MNEIFHFCEKREHTKSNFTIYVSWGTGWEMRLNLQTFLMIKILTPKFNVFYALFNFLYSWKIRGNFVCFDFLITTSASCSPKSKCGHVEPNAKFTWQIFLQQQCCCSSHLDFLHIKEKTCQFVMWTTVICIL